MKILNKHIAIKTKKFLEFIDITDQITQFIHDSKITNGQVLVYSKHTTVAIRINEREKGIFGDFNDLISKVIPKNVYYRHNDLNIRTENLNCEIGASDCMNGHSHCLHLLMGASETVPIIDGGLELGRYQRIFVVELDVARNRQVFLQIIGK